MMSILLYQTVNSDEFALCVVYQGTKTNLIVPKRYFQQMEKAFKVTMELLFVVSHFIWFVWPGPGPGHAWIARNWDYNSVRNKHYITHYFLNK